MNPLIALGPTVSRELGIPIGSLCSFHLLSLHNQLNDNLATCCSCPSSSPASFCRQHGPNTNVCSPHSSTNIRSNPIRRKSQVHTMSLPWQNSNVCDSKVCRLEDFWRCTSSDLVSWYLELLKLTLYPMISAISGSFNSIHASSIGP